MALLKVCTARSARPFVDGWYGAEVANVLDAILFHESTEFVAGERGSVIRNDLGWQTVGSKDRTKSWLM